MVSQVPFVNLERKIQLLKPEFMEAIERVVDSRAFILGPEVESFEAAFAFIQGAAFCVGCSSGTSAVSLALEALGVKEGDEVICQANTFFATAEAICNVGATPVFVDVLPGDYSVDPEAIKQAITEKTKAIIPVHLYGVPANMEAIMEIANEHKLLVVEDTAQGHLAKIKDKCVGNFGNLGAFSFFPGKNLGAFGDAGAIIGQDPDLKAKLLKLRNHGRKEKYLHEAIAYNHRVDGIQAAVLQVKLKYLEQWTKHRNEVASLYNACLRPHGIKTIELQEGVTSSYHLYVIEVDDPNKVQAELKAKGIGSGMHYPVPLHQQPAFSYLPKVSLPVAEKTAKRLLSIPICGSIELEEAQYVAKSVIEVLGK